MEGSGRRKRKKGENTASTSLNPPDSSIKVARRTKHSPFHHSALPPLTLPSPSYISSLPCLLQLSPHSLPLPQYLDPYSPDTSLSPLFFFNPHSPSINSRLPLSLLLLLLSFLRTLVVSLSLPSFRSSLFFLLLSSPFSLRYFPFLFLASSSFYLTSVPSSLHPPSPDLKFAPPSLPVSCFL